MDGWMSGCMCGIWILDLCMYVQGGKREENIGLFLSIQRALQVARFGR